MNPAPLGLDCPGSVEIPASPQARSASERGARPAPQVRPIRNPGLNVGRNERCPCGSGKKFKKCCALAEAHAGQQLFKVARPATILHNGTKLGELAQ